MTTFGILAALFLTLYLLGLAYAKSSLRNLNITVEISAQTAIEGEELVLTETLTNESWLPLPWVAVKFWVDGSLSFADDPSKGVSQFRNDLFHILMHQKVRRRLKVTCAKRGYYTIQDLEITGWDILMEKKYIKKYPCEAQLTVYPSPLSVPETEDLCTQVNGQMRTRRPIYPDPFTFRGIR